MGRIPLARPAAGEAEVEAVRRVVRSGWLTQGPEVAALEREVAALLGGELEVVAVSSGGAALLLALQAIGVGRDDEVVVPAYTFPAAAQAALLLGARPVPADVEPMTLSPGPDEVTARLSPRTRAVVVADAFGIPSNVESVTEVCRREGIPVIEDAACSLGGRTRLGRPSGTAGDIGCFSLHPRKLATTGEGGLIACGPEGAARVRALRDYGRTGRGFGDVFGEVGLNFRMSDIQAAFGRVQVSRLPEHLAARARVAAAYHQALEGVLGIGLPEGSRHPGATHQTFVVRVADAAAVAARLDEAGIGAGPAAHDLTEQSFYTSRLGPGPECPVAAALARELLAIPLYEGMTVADVGRVVDALEEAVRGG